MEVRPSVAALAFTSTGLGAGVGGGWWRALEGEGTAYPVGVYEGIVQDLIDELGRLPGIGPKGAQRIAFHIVQTDPEDVDRLVAVLREVKAKIRFCDRCGNVAEAALCRICADTRRDQTSICVVEEPKDVAAIERTREFRGTYHVLGGAISPMDGVGPEDLRIRELLSRLAGRDGPRGHSGHRPEHRGRSDGDLPVAQPRAAGSDCDPPRLRAAGRGGPRIR